MLNKTFFSKYIQPLAPIPTKLARCGRLEKKIQGILFDVYGTLLISAAGDIGLAAAEQKTTHLRRLLRDYQLPQAVEGIRDKFTKAILARHEEMKQNNIDYPEVRVEEIWMSVTGMKDIEKARQFAMAYELILNPVYPMPHMRPLLESCRNKKLTMGIISNAQFYTSLLLHWFLKNDMTDIGFHPDLLIYSYQFGYAKPSGFLFDVARKRLDALGISADRVLYVGNDMLNDILPAKKTGFKAALFAGDARSLRTRREHPDCVKTAPDLVITDLIQLLDYI